MNPFLAIFCFLFWGGMGFLEFKRSIRLKPKYATMGRLLKVLMGSGLIVGGAVLLFAIFYAVAISLQKSDQVLSPGNWLIIFIGGATSVRAQVWGALLLFSLAEGPLVELKPQVTPDPTKSSESR